MQQPLVSVVVPVYKVEQYLVRCVDSLLKQTLKELEIILVDDGSPDGCGAICDEFQARDCRIKVIHKQNGGLPSARNAGIAVATGEYLGFVDSDDWVSEKMFEELYYSAKQKDADAAVCDYVMVGDKNIVVAGMGDGPKNIGAQLLAGIKPIAWNKIYRRSQGLHFYEHLRFAEDRPTVIPFLIQSNRVVYVQQPLYYYFQRNESIVNKYAQNVSFLHDIDSLRLMLRDSEGKYQKQVAKYCADVLIWTISNNRRNSCKADMIEFLQELSPLFLQNRYVKSDKSLFWLLTRETVPKNLIYCDFTSGNKSNNVQKICRESWEKYAVGMKFWKLDQMNCDIENAPRCVKQAFQSGNTRFAGDYFRLKTVYEHGGIAIDDSVRFNLPVGGLRAERTFFGYENAEEINGHIFGSVAEAKVLRDVLDTYETDSLLNDDAGWTLPERILTVLHQYGLREKGDDPSALLDDDVRLFGFDTLSHPVNAANVSQIVDELTLLAEERGCLLLDSNLLVSNIVSNDGGMKNKKQFQYQVKQLQMEVDRLKNSRSWKFTRPLRMLFNLFRKVKYSKEEIQ